MTSDGDPTTKPETGPGGRPADPGVPVFNVYLVLALATLWAGLILPQKTADTYEGAALYGLKGLSVVFWVLYVRKVFRGTAIGRATATAIARVRTLVADLVSRRS